MTEHPNPPATDPEKRPVHLHPLGTAKSESDSRIDSNLRLILSLVTTKDFLQLFLRTGIRKPVAGNQADERTKQYLPVLAELKVDPDQGISMEMQGELVLRFKVPPAYFEESTINASLRHVTARITLDPEIFDGVTTELRKELDALLAHAEIVSLAIPIQPCLEDSLRDIDLPADRRFNNRTVDGTGVIVGIIDDGCALAHRHFMKPGTAESRILYLWDQTAEAKDATKGWAQPPDFGYGYELENYSSNSLHRYIDLAIARHHVVPPGTIEEDDIYADLGYEIADLAAHGTHVMDIAAGNGTSPMGAEGVACRADIIFVQLPTAAIEAGDAGLWQNILDGAQYIFARAYALRKPAVVNISYGGYDGPHDGTSHVEKGLDQLLATVTDRAVVISAGNGFEADCHASGKIVIGGHSKPLRWMVLPEDPTPNDLEIWYNGSATLEFYLWPPDATTALGPVDIGQTFLLRRTADLKVIGRIEHSASMTGNNDSYVLVTLRPTIGDAEDGLNAPAFPGIWTIELRNVGNTNAIFDAWIRRDDAGRPGGARRRQSRFITEDADSRRTIAGLATGSHTIAVGAYNVGTQEVCRYSACGPTRATGGNPGRQKPEVCAPAVEDAAGRGILSASSRSAMPTRMNGTSASAPFVTGVVALMLQYNRDQMGGPLSADDIRDKLTSGATSTTLIPNKHEIADDTRPVAIKQAAAWADLIGAGKIDVIATLNLL